VTLSLESQLIVKLSFRAFLSSLGEYVYENRHLGRRHAMKIIALVEDAT
jgi:hypothetical protein